MMFKGFLSNTTDHACGYICFTHTDVDVSQLAISRGYATGMMQIIYKKYSHFVAKNTANSYSIFSNAWNFLTLRSQILERFQMALMWILQTKNIHNIHKKPEIKFQVDRNGYAKIDCDIIFPELFNTELRMLLLSIFALTQSTALHLKSVNSEDQAVSANFWIYNTPQIILLKCLHWWLLLNVLDNFSWFSYLSYHP